MDEVLPEVAEESKPATQAGSTSALRRWQAAVGRITAQRVVVNAFASTEPAWRRELRVLAHSGSFSLVFCPYNIVDFSFGAGLSLAGQRGGLFSRMMGAIGALHAAWKVCWRPVVCNAVPWRICADYVLDIETTRWSINVDDAWAHWPPTLGCLARAALYGLIATPFEMAFSRTVMGATPWGAQGSSFWSAWHLTSLLSMIGYISSAGDWKLSIIGLVCTTPLSHLIASLRAAEILRPESSPAALRLDGFWGLLCGGVRPRGLWGEHPLRAMMRSYAFQAVVLPLEILVGIVPAIFLDTFYGRFFGAAPIAEQRLAVPQVAAFLESREEDMVPITAALNRATERPAVTMVDLPMGLDIFRSLSTQLNGSPSGGPGKPASVSLARSLTSGLTRTLSDLRDAQEHVQLPQRAKSSIIDTNIAADAGPAVNLLSDKLELLLRIVGERRRKFLQEREWQIGDFVSVKDDPGLFGFISSVDENEVTLMTWPSGDTSGQTPRNIVRASAENWGPPIRPLAVERGRLIRTALAEIAARPPSELVAPDFGINSGLQIHLGLQARFTDEPAIDAGGVFHDFVDSMASALIDDVTGAASVSLPPDRPFASLRDGRVGLLTSSLDQTLLLAPATVRVDEHKRYLVALGRFLALTVVNRCPCPVPLSSIIFRCLLGSPISAADIRALDPHFWEHRLKPLLHKGGTESRQRELREWGMDPLTFVSVPCGGRDGGMPLCENGETCEVDEANCERYIQLVCDDFLIGSIRVELACLLEGFWEVLPREALESSGIDAEELRMLVAGIADLDVDEWERQAVARGPRSDEIKGWLFAWLRDRCVEDRARLLAFVTGLSRLPAGGWEALLDSEGRRIPFTVSVEGDDNALPSAHTCFNILVVPPVAGTEQLADKLDYVLRYAGREMLLV